MNRRRLQRDLDDRRLAAVLGFSPAGEGLAVLPGEAEGLLEAAAALTQWAPEPPGPGLEARIVAEADAATCDSSPAWAARRQRPALLMLLEAVRPHVRIFRAPFWLATLFVVAAGLPLLTRGGGPAGLLDLDYAGFLVLVAPVIAVTGTAYAFRSCGTGMAELEMTTPLTPWQLIAGRLAWVLAYDSLLLGVCSLAAVAAGAGLALRYLVAAWLGPMLALVLLDLVLTAYLQPWVAAGVCLGLWSATVAYAHHMPWIVPLTTAGTPGAMAPSALVLGVCVALLPAVALSGRRLAENLAGVLPHAGGLSDA